jgi:LmbE family N-acetylglucosaminyl deacetylase
MITNIFNKVLVIGAHTDDGEIGAGATISRLCREGKEVYYVAFSICEESILKEFPNDITSKEIIKAGSKLGIPQDNIQTLRYKVRKFPENRQDILEDMVKLNNNIQPDLVLLHNSFDIHQDHKTIYEEGLRAFKKTSILGYELPWNNLDISNRCFIKVQEQDLKNKLDSILEYKSQSFRNYINEEYIKSLMIVRGKQVNFNLAESFEVIRLIF